MAAEADVAAKLIERLLADPAFRARFRRDPAGACREAGLEELAQEMSLGAGKAMHTLDMRESKSSLAGVMMAAAMEGVGIYQFSENVLPHLEEVPGAVADVLSRVDLPAIDLKGALGGGGGGAAAAAAPASADPGAAGGGAAVDGAAAGTPAGAAAGTPPPPAAPPPAPEPKGAEAAADAPKPKATPPPEAAKAKGDEAADKAAEKIAKEFSPEAAEKQAQKDAAAALDEQTTGLPSSSDLPSGESAAADGVAPADAAAPAGAPPAPPPADAPAPAGAPPAAPPADGSAPPAAPPDTTLPGDAAPAADAGPPDTALPDGDAAAAVPDTDLPTKAPEHFEGVPAKQVVDAPGGKRSAAAAVDVAQAPKRQPIDPAQFGGDGTGGEPDPEAVALLKNKNVVLDADGIADIKAGRIDPRVVGVLTKLGQEHKIVVSSISSDHPELTAGGSVSNHHLGRGVDIASIDGETVGPDSPLARAVASELSSLDPDIRPDEIGSPFQIKGPGYFSDAAHQNHIHIGFKQEIPPDWTPPADVAAGGAPAAQAAAVQPPAAAPVAAAPVAAPAAVTPAPVAPAAPAAPPPEVRKGSQMFLKAVTAEDAAAEQKKIAGSDSLAFLKAVEPPKASAASAAPGAPAAAEFAAVAAAAPDAYPGDDAPREQIAAWMAGQAEKRGLPPELPLMASLVESGMKNLNFGDADSVGFFQMRVGTWNSGPYAGYPDKPELQVKWFLDQAEAVKKQRIAAGKPIDDPNQYGEWIADVERPAEQYRGRYQLKLAEAQDLLRSRPAAPPPAAAVDVAAVAPGGGGEPARRRGAAHRREPARRARDRGREPRPAGRPVPRGRGGRAGQPLVRVVHHVVAGAGWAQDARRRLGGGRDLGPQRRAGQQRAEGRERRRGAARRHRRVRLGRPGRLRRRRPHRVPRQHGQGRQVHRAGGQQRRRRQLRPARARRREHQVHPRRGQRPARRGRGRRRPPGRGPLGADRPGAVRRRRHRRPAEPRSAGAAAQQEHRARRRRDHRHQGGPHRPARGRRAHQAQPGAQDHGHVHVLGPLEVHRRRLGLQPPPRPRRRHRRDRRRDRRARQPAGPRRRQRAVLARPEHPAGRDRLAVRDLRPRLLHRRRAPEPPAHRLQAGDHAGLDAARRRGGQRAGGRSRRSGRRGRRGAGRSPGGTAARDPQGLADVPQGGPRRGGDRQARRALLLAAVHEGRRAAEGERGRGAGRARRARRPGRRGGRRRRRRGGHARRVPRRRRAARADRRVDGRPGREARAAAAAAGDGLARRVRDEEPQLRRRRLGRVLPDAGRDLEPGRVRRLPGQAGAAGQVVPRPGRGGQAPAARGRQADRRPEPVRRVDRRRRAARRAVPRALPAAARRGQRAAEVGAGAARRGPRGGRARAARGRDPRGGRARAARGGRRRRPGRRGGARGRAPAERRARAAAGGDRGGQRARPEGAGGDRGGVEAHRHAVQVGRLDAADRLRLLGADAVVLRAVGDPDPARDVHADRGAERRRGRRGAPQARRPRVLRQRRRRPPRRHVHRRRQVPARAAHRRRGQGLEPRRAVLQVAVRRRAALRPERAGGARTRGAAAAVPVAAPPAAPPAPPVDPTDVAKAQAAVARDAAEVRRNDSQLFQAITAVEASKEREKNNSAMFLKAIDPSQVAPKAAPAAAPPAPPPAAPAPAAAAPVPPPEAAAPSVPVSAPPEAVASASIDLTNAATEYPGDNASQAQLARWLGKQAEKAGLPPELPVMASLVESGVKNLDYGDRDSVGFFQMRTEIWDQGQYAGYPDKPELQAKWFIDQALAVKRKAIANGDADFGKNPAKFGEWIADVERPAEEYRYRYQLRLDEARKLLGAKAAAI